MAFAGGPSRVVAQPPGRPTCSCQGAGSAFRQPDLAEASCVIAKHTERRTRQTGQLQRLSAERLSHGVHGDERAHIQRHKHCHWYDCTCGHLEQNPGASFSGILWLRAASAAKLFPVRLGVWDCTPREISARLGRMDCRKQLCQQEPSAAPAIDRSRRLEHRPTDSYPFTHHCLLPKLQSTVAHSPGKEAAGVIPPL